MPSRSPDLAEVLSHTATDKRIDILRRIGEGGSISEAARRAGVSYKAAWQAIETLGNLAGTPLVDKAVGGSGGGGAALTAAGRRVLDAAALLDRARAGVLHSLRAEGRGDAAAPGLAGLALQTSMRNQCPCVVAGLRQAGGTVQVRLTLPGGACLSATITRESAQLLQLRPGLQVLALCKATAVHVAPLPAPPWLPDEGGNVVTGCVTRTSRSRHGGEVSLRLDGGTQLVGFSAEGQRLRPGDAAVASFDASAVVVAVSG